LKPQEGISKIQDIMTGKIEYKNKMITNLNLGIANSSNEELFYQIKNQDLGYFNFGELDVDVTSLDNSMKEFVIEQTLRPQILINENYFFESTVKKLLIGKYTARNKFKYAHTPSIKKVFNFIFKLISV
jgi:hypothetical protein